MLDISTSVFNTANMRVCAYSVQVSKEHDMQLAERKKSQALATERVRPGSHVTTFEC